MGPPAPVRIIPAFRLQRSVRREQRNMQWRWQLGASPVYQFGTMGAIDLTREIKWTRFKGSLVFKPAVSSWIGTAALVSACSRPQ
jgi:hypothetical protein